MKGKILLLTLSLLALLLAVQAGPVRHHINPTISRCSTVVWQSQSVTSLSLFTTQTFPSLSVSFLTTTDTHLTFVTPTKTFEKLIQPTFFTRSVIIFTDTFTKTFTSATTTDHFVSVTDTFISLPPVYLSTCIQYAYAYPSGHQFHTGASQFETPGACEQPLCALVPCDQICSAAPVSEAPRPRRHHRDVYVPAGVDFEAVAAATSAQQATAVTPAGIRGYNWEANMAERNHDRPKPTAVCISLAIVSNCATWKHNGVKPYCSAYSAQLANY